ncbi:hypothetical protein RSSM_00721 [Rhodopirellula sallentina SM41]|uniref:Uncharacterized protein n=1 Tax=Rhodopirellula sallentina SM41 TaxID=1263870 RepID=M5UPB9_9BACT|nr:hypothetical protein RSSM_00721 [Rhodopirellula sallentina SM41]
MAVKSSVVARNAASASGEKKSGERHILNRKRITAQNELARGSSRGGEERLGGRGLSERSHLGRKTLALAGKTRGRLAPWAFCKLLLNC